MEGNLRDGVIAIIGGGPTGATLAHLLSRQGHYCDLFEAKNLGGQFSTSYDWQLTNTPGSAISLPGLNRFCTDFPRLRDVAKSIANSIHSNPNVNAVFNRVLRVDYGDDAARILLESGNTVSYQKVFVCIGRGDRRRKITLNSKVPILDPYLDTGIDIDGPCYVIGSGATAVDCSVELVFRGRSVNHVINRPINYIARPKNVKLVDFALSQWERDSVRFLSGKALLIKKKVWLRTLPTAIRPFFDSSSRQASIVMNDVFVDFVKRGLINVINHRTEMSLPRDATVYNCTGYESVGTPIERLCHAKFTRVYRVGGSYQRHQPWLNDCQNICLVAIKRMHQDCPSYDSEVSGHVKLDQRLRS